MFASMRGLAPVLARGSRGRMCAGEGPASAAEGPGICHGEGLISVHGMIRRALFKSLKPASTRFSVVR